MDKTTLLKKFGKNVKIERIKKDLTQEQLAEIMNVSQNYIANIERGKANPSLETMQKIAAYTGATVAEMLTVKNQEEE